MAQQGGFPGAAGPGQHYGGESASRAKHLVTDGAGDEPHMSILNQKFRFLNSWETGNL
jgi:hypothetical protein